MYPGKIKVFVLWTSSSWTVLDVLRYYGTMGIYLCFCVFLWYELPMTSLTYLVPGAEINLLTGGLIARSLVSKSGQKGQMPKKV